MKRLLILLLLCALALTGCVTLKPEDPVPDGDGVQQPAPAPSPTDEELAAMRPRLILDGCEPGEADGLTLRVREYASDALTVEYANACGETRAYYESFTLSVRDGGQWTPLPWPEDRVWPDSEYLLEPGEQATLTLDLSGLGALTSGEYLLKTGSIETSFWLVYTE